MPDTDELDGSKKPEAFGNAETDAQSPDKKSSDDKKTPSEDESSKNKPPAKPFWKRPILLSVMILVAITIAIAGTIYVIHSEHYESTDDAFIDGRIAHISPRVAGKVTAIKVEDNQIVSADQPLIVIDSQPYEVRLHQAQAAQSQAEAQVDQAGASVEVARANAAQSEADVTVAEANAQNARQDFDRFNKVDPAARSRQQLDASTANLRSSEAQVTAAKKKSDSMHAMIKSAEKTRDAAMASVAAAIAQVEQAKLDLSYTTVVAGHAGRVTRRTVEVGNYVSIGQEVLDIASTQVPQDIWVTANFKETQLAKMEKGQRVEITIDAYPDEKLHGHIDSIQNGTGAVFSLLPAENATGNYVKVVQRVPVKIVLDDQPRHLLSPGMSVQPEVDVRDHRQSGDGQTASASNSENRP